MSYSPFVPIRTYLRSSVPSLYLNSVRHASLNSAIGRGIRKTHAVKDFPPSRGSSKGDNYRQSGNRDSRPQNGSFNSRFSRGSSRTRDVKEFPSSRGPSNRDNYRQSGDRDTRRHNDSFNSRSSRDSPRSRDIKDSSSRKFSGEDNGHRRGGERASRPQNTSRDSDTRSNLSKLGATRGYRPSRTFLNEDTEHHSAEENSSRPQQFEHRKQGRQVPAQEFDEAEFIKTGKFRGLPYAHQRGKSLEKPDWVIDKKNPENLRRSKVQPPEPADNRIFLDNIKDQDVRGAKEHVKVPTAIPYTTPASEFIYGTSAVEAALRCNRRKLYKLYLYQPAGEGLGDSKNALRKIALTSNIPVKLAYGEWDRLLDKMSTGRPHNGCILEASPLPNLPIQSFKEVLSHTDDHFNVELGIQSREEAIVNGINDRININQSPQQKRYPVVMMLDGIVDSGNLGAIIRTAYYLGIDAVVFAGKNSAPLNPVTIKASAGAAESMTLLKVNNEVDFIHRSQANGWTFYAADAPTPGSKSIDPFALRGAQTKEGDSIGIVPSPTVIMMGNEGSGLSKHIKAKANHIVSIPGARNTMNSLDPAKVDSLNVSVAAALLMEMFLRTPYTVGDVAQKKKSG